MISIWPQFRAQIFYALLVFGLFAVALNMQPLMQKHIVVSEANIVEELPEVFVNIPDFGSILDVQLKKQAFFSFLQPYIDKENRQILLAREALLSIHGKILSAQSLSAAEISWFTNISEEYELEDSDIYSATHLQRLLKRIDIIPSSLVLAQAANESAWGTSRFAQKGNNFFGQWCYSEGCGIVPSRRGAGAKHEVKKFDDVGDSVHAYFMNLNTFPSYEELREIRQDLRISERTVDGISLTAGLRSYSERGDEYIWELQSMIYSNELMSRDEA